MAIRSFKEMQDEILVEIDASSDTTIRGYVKTWLNRYDQEFASVYEFPELVARWKTTLTTDAQSDTSWPKLETLAPHDIVSIYGDQCEIIKTSATPDTFHSIEFKPTFEFDRLTRGNLRSSDTAQPSMFSIRKRAGVLDNVAGGTLTAYTVVSSSASDVSGSTIQCSLTGFTDADRRAEVKQTGDLNGTTAVSFATQIMWPTTATKETDTTGIVTFATAAGTAIATLMPWDRAANYTILEFFPFPDESYDFELVYKRRPPPMTNDADVPAYTLPEAHDCVFYKTLEKALSWRGDARTPMVTRHKDEAYALFSRKFPNRDMEVEHRGFVW